MKRPRLLPQDVCFTLLLTRLMPVLLAIGAALAEAGNGAGNFGQWITDEHRLPAYRFRENPNADPTVVSRSPYHQIGNLGITANAHYEGYVELFSTRSFPKFHNRYNPERQAFAGGFGWIRDTATDRQWCTLKSCLSGDGSYQWTLGVGYSRKVSTRDDIRVEETQFAPNGDDETLILTVAVTNHSNHDREVSYYGYWDIDPLYPRFTLGPLWKDKYESHDFTTAHLAEKRALIALSTVEASDVPEPRRYSDPVPRGYFLAVLDGSLDSFETVKKGIFEQTDSATPRARLPAGRQPLSNSLRHRRAADSEDIALLTETRLQLAPGETKTFTLAYGAAEKDDLAAHIDHLRARSGNLLGDMLSHYQKVLPKVTLPQPELDWVNRELTWSTYYLLSGFFREDFFGADARVLNQASVYLYDMGINAAMRDPLQHAMPLTYITPDLTRETINYVLRTMQEDGEIPWGTMGYGHKSSGDLVFEPSDLALWLLWGVTEYVFVTRDYAFLDAPQRYMTGKPGTTYSMMKQALAYQIDQIGYGEHGLVKLLNGDWSDLITSESGNLFDTWKYGESTLNTAIALAIYPRFKALAAKKGDRALVEKLDHHIAKLETALKAQWRGTHFNRAYTRNGDDEVVDIGRDSVWLGSNGFALHAEGLLSGEQLCGETGLVNTIKTRSADPVAFGMPVAADLPPDSPYAETPTMNSNWFALSGAAIRGLAKHAHRCEAAKRLAWQEFLENTLHHHGNLYPDIWYGIWSSADALFHDNQPHFPPGHTWMDLGFNTEPDPFFTLGYPPENSHIIANMHAHAQPLLTGIRMLGIWPTATGLNIRPSLPFAAGFRWSSAVIRLSYDSDRIEGAYRPEADDSLVLEVDVDRHWDGKLRVEVNGDTVPHTRSGQRVRFILPVTADTWSRWSIRTLAPAMAHHQVK